MPALQFFGFSSWELVSRKLAIDFTSVTNLNRDLSFGLGVVEMRDGLRHREEAMNVISFRKQLARNFPSGGAILRHETDDSVLTLANRAQITIEQFFVVVNRFAVSAINQSRRETAHARKTDEILGQRLESARRIDWIRRDDGIRSDALQHTIARDNCAISFTKKRA